MQRIFSFISEVRFEISKVTWPKRDEVIRLTLVVFIISGIFGAYIGGLDYLFTKLLEILVSK